ncbi:MAG: hypothetical protein CM1200mP18_03300 [Gammaproteobacteria bacterium]|nr:MAG: hypothetical protein CM1200mP18_03300 [Gammaproteobacteria bacterium]
MKMTSGKRWCLLLLLPRRWSPRPLFGQIKRYSDIAQWFGKERLEHLQQLLDDAGSNSRPASVNSGPPKYDVDDKPMTDTSATRQTLPVTAVLGTIEATDPTLVGPKMVHVDWLRRQDAHVPEAFCITTEAFEKFLDHNALAPITGCCRIKLDGQ